MFIRRIIGVFKLDPRTFEEVEHDRGATGQAALVVSIVALLTATGNSALSAISGSGFLETFILTLLWTFVGWFVWSAITYFIGVNLFAGRADLGEMLRVIGFASAPLSLGIIPCIGGIAGALWTAAAAYVAIRAGLDLDSGRAFLTMVIGFIVYALGYLSITVLLFIFRMIFAAS
jgi:hypothetical protein